MGITRDCPARPNFIEVRMSWLWMILGNTVKWIGINIGLPLIIDFINKQSTKPKFINKQSTKPKFIDSAEPDDEDAKAIEKAKKDGWK